MNNRTEKSPRLARLLLRQLTDYHEQYSFVNEIEEVYNDIFTSRGAFAAYLWYWYQCMVCCYRYACRNIIWSVMMIGNYFKIAMRSMLGNKAYSFINLSGLAMGMACCIMIFLWVQDELGYDRFHENVDRLYMAINHDEGRWRTSTPLVLAVVLEREFPEIEKVVRVSDRIRTLKADENVHNIRGAFVGENFFDMFSFPFIAGNPETAFTSRKSIVISEDFAKRFFGNEDPLGKIVTMNNTDGLTVTGIVRNVPSNSTLQFDFLAPIQLYTREERLNTSWSSELYTFILLKKNIDVSEFRNKIEGVLRKFDRRTIHNDSLVIQSVGRMHLYNMGGSGPIIFVYIFSIIAVLILLIACVNFINLATARSGRRAREIGMRKVLGAVKTNIIGQFYSESMISTFAALVLALLLVYLLLPSFNTLSNKQLSFGIIGNPSSILGLIIITVFTGLVAGGYPALVLSSFKPVAVLKSSFQSGKKKINLRRALIIGQFTATVILIIGTIVIYRQLQFIRNRDLGLNKDYVVSIPFNNQLRQNYQAFKEELKNHQGIVHVSAASSLPTQINGVNPVYWEGKTKDNYVTISHVVLDYDYFEIFEMDMLFGRSFSEEFPTDVQNYIINEAALKLTGFKDPVGKLYSIWEDEGKIIGVVKDFHNQSLHAEITPTVFTLNPRHFRPFLIFVRIRSENIPATMKYIENLTREFAPAFPYEYTFVDETFEQQYRGDRRIGSIFTYFALLAIFISCLGLLGMASFMAQQRTREVGIRKVLGASVRSVVQLMIREFLVLVCVSNIAAWPIAYFVMEHLLNNYAYRIDISVWIFIFSGAFSLTIALLTVTMQTIKAALVNPVDTLRHE